MKQFTEVNYVDACPGNSSLAAVSSGPKVGIYLIITTLERLIMLRPSVTEEIAIVSYRVNPCPCLNRVNPCLCNNSQKLNKFKILIAPS